VTSSSSRPRTPEGPGSVSGAPNLPMGFTATFTSRYIDTGEVRLHAVIGDDGHWVAEEAPEEMLAALAAFMAPYRDGEAAAHDPRARTTAATPTQRQRGAAMS
jgi:hypothetical protein